MSSHDGPEFAPGTCIDGSRYEVSHVLGRGGFGVVYACRDRRTQREVAIKLLNLRASQRADLRERFLIEARVLLTLQHHNTIKVLDLGDATDGSPFIVMELLHGVPLDTVLLRERRLAPVRVARIAICVLKSLAEAHAQKIVHRDVKPANVFLVELHGETDYAKVLDFGIAKMFEGESSVNLTSSGQLYASPAYVAPERLLKGHAGPAADIYSLGIMMIELLTGRLPYSAPTPEAMYLHHASPAAVPLPRGVLNTELGRILERATAKDESVRYQSALEMAADLGACLSSLSTVPLTDEEAASTSLSTTAGYPTSGSTDPTNGGRPTAPGTSSGDFPPLRANGRPAVVLGTAAVVGVAAVAAVVFALRGGANDAAGAGAAAVDAVENREPTGSNGLASPDAALPPSLEEVAIVPETDSGGTEATPEGSAQPANPAESDSVEAGAPGPTDEADAGAQPDVDAPPPSGAVENPSEPEPDDPPRSERREPSRERTTDEPDAHSRDVRGTFL